MPAFQVIVTMLNDEQTSIPRNTFMCLGLQHGSESVGRFTRQLVGISSKHIYIDIYRYIYIYIYILRPQELLAPVRLDSDVISEHTSPKSGDPECRPEP